MTRKFSTNPRLFVLVAGALSLFFLVSLGQGLSQQDPAEKNERQQQSGMSTGAAHAPVKDALLRPITAGGLVDGAPVVFADITHAARLDKFHHRSGTPEKSTILETPGSREALVDYDDDCRPDIYLLNESQCAAIYA